MAPPAAPRPAPRPAATDGGPSHATTQPPRTTTTGEQQDAAAQREGSAKAAAAYLANVVLTGDTSGARSLVATEAQASSRVR